MVAQLTATRTRRGLIRRALAGAEERLGGPARRRVIVLFACVLALESADLGTIGAVATQLEHGFHIRHAQLGLLASVSLLVGAAVTVPFGVLADRTNRVRLLAGSIVAWSLAMAATGAAPSYGWLIVTRLGLGAALAAAGPLVASLTGDLFDPDERGRIYGYVLSGEFVGAAIGFLVSGNLAALTSWRVGFWVLSVPGLALAFALHRLLPEPPRGGRGRIREGAEELPEADEDDPEAAETARMPLARAVRAVLGIRTNVILIAASALGYFFFAGMRTFTVAFLRGQFSLGQAAATTLLVVIGLGSLTGVLLGGRLADGMRSRGRVDARIVAPALAFVVAAIALAPAIATTSLAVAAPLLLLGGAALAAANPPLDAARLDIVPARLWGRAESVRTVLRQVAQAAAPLLFGLVADTFGGLESAFLIMLVPLAASGAIVWRARRTYARDARLSAQDRLTDARSYSSA